jgi:hypothetical protein
MSPSAAMAIVCCALATTACFGDLEPVATEVPECRQPQIDTTGWARVRETRTLGALSSATITYLVPPTFERAGPYSWQRGATLTNWQTRVDEPLVVPFPELRYTGSCRARIADRTVVFDYGSVDAGGPVPDAAIIGVWNRVPLTGAVGDILFSGRVRDHSDILVLERMLFSVQVLRGPGSDPGD